MDAFVTRARREEPEVRVGAAPPPASRQTRIEDCAHVVKGKVVGPAIHRLRELVESRAARAAESATAQAAAAAAAATPTVDADEAGELERLLTVLEANYISLEVLQETRVGMLVNTLRSYPVPAVAALAGTCYMRWRAAAHDTLKRLARRELDAAAAGRGRGGGSSGSGSDVLVGTGAGLARSSSGIPPPPPPPSASASTSTSERDGKRHHRRAAATKQSTLDGSAYMDGSARVALRAATAAAASLVADVEAWESAAASAVRRPPSDSLKRRRPVEVGSDGSSSDAGDSGSDSDSDDSERSRGRERARPGRRPGASGASGASGGGVPAASLSLASASTSTSTASTSCYGRLQVAPVT